MQTFKQYILEADAPVNFDDFIRENCGPYLKLLESDLDVLKSTKFSLYRGIAEVSNAIPMIYGDDLINGYVKNVRTDRKPKDTPKAITEVVDDMLEQKFGWRPRTQGAFCYTYKNRNGVELYGRKYKIYPMGPLEFVYSAKVQDLTLQLSRYLQGKNLWPRYGSVNLENQQDTEDAIKEFIEDMHYTNENLPKAMLAEGKPEIMIRCNKYLAVIASLHD